MALKGLYNSTHTNASDVAYAVEPAVLWRC